MIIDERIQNVRNRAAAGGFGIVYGFLLIDLLFRQFYLKQAPGEYWDIFIIWFASSVYVGIIAYSSGMMSGHVGRQFKVLIPVIIITLFLISLIQGDITSAHDLAGIIAGLVAAVPAIFAVFLFYNYLNRRWEKKNELDEQE